MSYLLVPVGQIVAGSLQPTIPPHNTRPQLDHAATSLSLTAYHATATIVTMTTIATTIITTFATATTATIFMLAAYRQGYTPYNPLCVSVNTRTRQGLQAILWIDIQVPRGLLTGRDGQSPPVKTALLPPPPFQE